MCIMKSYPLPIQNPKEIYMCLLATPRSAGLRCKNPRMLKDHHEQGGLLRVAMV